MEKDSFESKLQELIQQADCDLPPNVDGRERVWTNVKIYPSPRRKKYFAVAAVLLLMGIGTLLIHDNQGGKIVRPKEAREYVSEPKAILADTVRFDKPKVITARVTFRNRKKAVPELILTADTFHVIRLSTPSAESVIKMPTSPVIENRPLMISVNKKADTETQVSVQFKRGKTINAVDIPLKNTTALFKLKFGRDTSVIANAEVKSNHVLKIKF